MQKSKGGVLRCYANAKMYLENAYIFMEITLLLWITVKSV